MGGGLFYKNNILLYALLCNSFFKHYIIVSFQVPGVTFGQAYI